MCLPAAAALALRRPVFLELGGFDSRFVPAWWEDVDLAARGHGDNAVARDVATHVAQVFEQSLPSMRSVWELARGHGDKDYIVYEDERYTYAEADAIVRALAHHLRDVHGVVEYYHDPGRRVLAPDEDLDRALGLAALRACGGDGGVEGA